MPTIEIGARKIDYQVHTSARASRMRIEVTPQGVHVVAPEDTSAAEVEQFVERRRRWLHDKTKEIDREIEQLKAKTPEGYHSGAKVLFRGRYLKVKVETSDVGEPTLAYKTAFHVDLPKQIDAGDRESVVRELITTWLERRLTKDVREMVRRLGHPHGLEPQAIRIKTLQTLWGSCGRDEVIRLDRRLIRLPKPVLEYVMVHELCHLAYRHHSSDFWDLVQTVMPDYQERKDWLECHELELG